MGWDDHDIWDVEDMFDDEDFRSNSRSDLNDFTWTTLKGEILNIWDMTDSHIINAIHHLEKKGTINPFLNFEAARRKLKLKSKSKNLVKETQGFSFSLGMDDPNEGCN